MATIWYSVKGTVKGSIVFEKLLSESTLYLCPHCTVGKQYNETSAIKETIKTLNDKLDSRRKLD